MKAAETPVMVAAEAPAVLMAVSQVVLLTPPDPRHKHRRYHMRTREIEEAECQMLCGSCGFQGMNNVLLKPFGLRHFGH